MTNDLISRQAAMDALNAVCDRECEYSKQQRSVMCGACRLGSAFDAVEELPSAQPSLDEWCTDCKEYDHERHFCPRFDRVISEAVKEVRENAKEERRGKWLLHEYPDGYYHTECSECGNAYDEKVYFLKTALYCPKCGAKMSKGDEEE